MTSFIIKNGKLTQYCGNEETVTVPDGVTEICARAFENNVNLKSLYVPQSVQYVGESAFMNCSSLKSAVMDGVRCIGARAFCGCSSLINIPLPKTVEMVYFMAFCDCRSIREIKLIGDLRGIDEGTFRGCTSLYRVSLSSSTVRIAASAFSDCPSLEEIVVSPLRFSLLDENNEAFPSLIRGCFTYAEENTVTEAEKNVFHKYFLRFFKRHTSELADHPPSVRYMIANGIMDTDKANSLLTHSTSAECRVYLLNYLGSCHPKTDPSEKYTLD